MIDNIILATDSYKVSHAEQYPPNTTNIYSYFESRGGRFREVVFYGLQYYIKKYLTGIQVTTEKINKAEKILKSHLGESINWVEWRKRWEYIVDAYGGKLPVKIKAVPEGSVIPVHNVIMTVENTDPKC